MDNIVQEAIEKEFIDDLCKLMNELSKFTDEDWQRLRSYTNGRLG